MILLTATQRDRLLANGRQRDQDHIPVVKFFNPLGEGVWLATELDEDGDIMFGLADLGYPELGSWSLSEMQSVLAALRHGHRARSAVHRGFPDLGLGRGRPRDRKHPRRRASALPRRREFFPYIR